MDVELWPRGWEGYRDEAADAYKRYILGETPRGDYGLPFQLRIAKEHGLRFVFFVESLFAREIGFGFLRETVDLITEAGQEVQLHVHPEWVTHSANPIVHTAGRFTLSEFSLEEQTLLIESALENLDRAGAQEVNAFRAGSFAANAHTLLAASKAGLGIDSSFKLGSELGPTPIAIHELEDDDRARRIIEYPLTTYEDWPGRKRHLQLTACSLGEILFILRRASQERWPSVVMLSHSAELLDAERVGPDRFAVRRFEKLCRWLTDNPEVCQTSWFNDADGRPSIGDCETIRSSVWRTAIRMGEQTIRRLKP